MQFTLLRINLAVLVLCISPWAAAADDATHYAARMAARHDLELAKMDLRHYWQIDHPRRLRHLDAQIELTEIEIDMLRERLREYRPFGRISTGRALAVTVQETKLCLREAELRLHDLRAERNALMRYRSDQWRILEQQVHAARLRVAMLEAGD